MKTFLSNIRWFLSNLWFYRKILWNTRNFDHAYCTDIFLKSLERLRDGIKHYNNHVNYKTDLKNINKTIRMIKRKTSDSMFDIAQRKYPTNTNLIFALDFTKEHREQLKIYYDEVTRLEKLIDKKIIKLLTNPQSGLETWWD